VTGQETPESAGSRLARTAVYVRLKERELEAGERYRFWEVESFGR